MMTVLIVLCAMLVFVGLVSVGTWMSERKQIRNGRMLLILDKVKYGENIE